MSNIICPNCKKSFELDETGYAALLGQVRDEEFNRQLNERMEIAGQERAIAVALVTEKLQAERDRVKLELEGRLVALEKDKDREILALQARIESGDDKRQLAIAEAVSGVRQELDEARADLRIERERHRAQLEEKDEAIERYKDFKLKLSTKMLGETLERHCENEFNRLRSAAFQNAYFERDNDVSSGSKGDYVFRAFGVDGSEIVSIMFEMKNESDGTASKKKNEDFLEKLDKDRRAKGCEYAILVSLLEADSELYNAGIVDMSHRYGKMYVIRPQFFIPMITILRNEAMRSVEIKAALDLARSQATDITNFEEKLEKFKTGFARNYDLASRQFLESVDELDKAIRHLQKMRDALLRSNNNLRLANEKVQDVTIKRLTHSNPTMKARFDALRSDRED